MPAPSFVLFVPGLVTGNGEPQFVQSFRSASASGTASPVRIAMVTHPFQKICLRAVVVLAILLACGSFGCKPANSYVAPPPPEVTVAHPIRKVVTRYLESTGTTEAYE